MAATLRAAVIFLVILAGTQPAEARRGGGGIVVINSGENILHIRDLPADVAGAIGYRKLGYKHALFGLFWFDLWRWDGEFVVYDPTVPEVVDPAGLPAFDAFEGSSITYAPIDESVLEQLGGASTPWRYHLPEGLLVLLALLELVIITKTRRPLKVTLAIGGTLVVLAGVFYLKGLTWEFMIPGFLGLHHLLGSYWAIKHPAVAPDAGAGATRAADDEAPEDAFDADPEVIAPRVSRPRMAPTAPPAARPVHESAPLPPSRPSRPVAPPGPLVVERPATAPVTAPVVHDAGAEAPKLLR